MKLNRRTTKLYRFADRYAGVPLIFLPSLYRAKREKPNDIKRICVIKTSGIGDTVLVSPVLKDILHYYPESEITFVTGDKNHDAAKFLMSSYTDRVKCILVDYKEFATIASLRRLDEFDLLIDFGQWPRFDAFVSMIIKSKFRIGFSRARQYRHYSYDMAVEHRSDRHELNNFRALAEALGIPCLHSPEVEVFADKWPGSFKESICVHICASGSTAEYRMWSAEKWAELAMHIIGTGTDVVFTGTEPEKKYLELVASYAGIDNDSILLDMPFEYLARIFRDCRAVISVDTGIAHFAAACGAKLIEILGPTNPDRWGAVGEFVTYVLPDRVDCMLDLGFERHADKDAINRITVEQVLEHLK